ncbi:MAG: S46 family peptidase [Pirellulaceae bacterium]
MTFLLQRVRRRRDVVVQRSGPLNNLEAARLHRDRGVVRALDASSVRFNSRLASFISSNGLVLTNHHVASDTLYKLSTPERIWWQILCPNTG